MLSSMNENEGCNWVRSPVDRYYPGRDMKTSHKGMRISEGDWSIFLQHAGAAMKALQIPKQECDEIVTFVLSLKEDIVEA